MLSFVPQVGAGRDISLLLDGNCVDSTVENQVNDENIDFEYKKYVLLAYLQSVKRAFDQSLLYPGFSDLISHYQNLHAFQQSKLQFEGAIPKQMRAVDWEKFQVLYASLLADDEALREIEEIVEFSLPQVKATVEEGKQLYELIEENIVNFRHLNRTRSLELKMKNVPEKIREIKDKAMNDIFAQENGGFASAVPRRRLFVAQRRQCPSGKGLFLPNYNV